MAAKCYFKLNGRHMSEMVCNGFGTVFAFSGNREDRNQPTSTAIPFDGPLPQGEYFIVDRESGGRLSRIRDFMQDTLAGTYRAGWFALYRNDSVIDDYTFINGVRRGHFRLHPVGRFGVSEGCITLPNVMQYYHLWQYLKSQQMERVPGSSLYHYGRVQVR
ncbi:DUF2778 domain-containing protein [Pantoea sp. B65]|uniref:DUF2778 domain-containing protein n=1 Tax=Pantoea sp. B65 TaxID=2813359 RepID=UPI0039B6E41C